MRGNGMPISVLATLRMRQEPAAFSARLHRTQPQVIMADLTVARLSSCMQYICPGPSGIPDPGVAAFSLSFLRICAHRL